MAGAVAHAVEEQDAPGGVDSDQPRRPFDLDDEALLGKVRDWLKEASGAKADVTPKRLVDFKMFAGDQWEEADAKLRKDLRAPTLTHNMVLGIVSAVEGEERTNRQEIKAYGRGVDDSGAAHALNLLIKWVIDGTGGQFALSEQFRNAIICGEGWICPEVDYFDDPEGIIKLDAVDDEEMFPDPLSRCPVGSDMRFIHRVKMMTGEEGEARWPGFREKVSVTLRDPYEPISETDGSGYPDIYLTPNNPKSLKMYDKENKLWAVTETWWSQVEPGAVVVDEATGTLEEKTLEELAALREAKQQEMQAYIGMAMNPPADPMTGLPAPVPPPPRPVEAIERPVRRWYLAITCHDAVLERKPSPLTRLKRAPYVPFRCIRDKVKREWFGIVRSVIAAQRQHNVEQSVIVQLMQLMPKQSWMGPRGAFADKEKWRASLAQPGALLEYNERKGKPEPVPVQPIPRHLIDMAFLRPQSMRDISGVNVEMTGQRQGSDPGVVMEMRQKAAKTVLAPIFDNWRQTKKELGRVLTAMIQEYVSPGRVIRVLGADGSPEVVALSEQDQLMRYDIVVDETTETVNDQIATLNMLQTTLPKMIQSGVPVVPEFIDLMPMKPHIRDRWKRQIAWEMAVAGKLPPEGWEPGMDPVLFMGLPGPGLQPGAGLPPEMQAPPQ